MKVYKEKSIRTNNFNNDPKKIIDLWQEVMTKFPEYKGDWYGVYHEYESDFKGNYTLTICTDTDIANTNEIIPIESNNYKTFEVTSSYELAYVWQKIWDLEIKESLNRAYTIDYEKYSNYEITIHIALK